MDDLFIKIIKGEIPSKKVYENDKVYAFEDINPQAPVHVIVVHKDMHRHVMDTGPERAYIYTDLFTAVREIALQLGIDEKGFRLILNNGSDAGQSVNHMHVHILAGKKFGPLIV